MAAEALDQAHYPCGQSNCHKLVGRRKLSAVKRRPLLRSLKADHDEHINIECCKSSPAQMLATGNDTKLLDVKLTGKGSVTNNIPACPHLLSSLEASKRARGKSIICDLICIIT